MSRNFYHSGFYDLARFEIHLVAIKCQKCVNEEYYKKNKIEKTIDLSEFAGTYTLDQIGGVLKKINSKIEEAKSKLVCHWTSQQANESRTCKWSFTKDFRNCSACDDYRPINK